MLALIRVIVVLSVLFCLMLKAHAEGEATLSGTVTGDSGQPVQAAEIHIQGKDASKVAKIHTNANGHYNYAALETGTYRVTLLVDGVIKASINNVRTNAGETQTLNFDLQKGAMAKPFAKRKHYVWIPSQTGSHLGVWLEVDDDAKGMSSGMAERLRWQGSALAKHIQDSGRHSGP